MGIDAEKRCFLLFKVIKTKDKDPVFQDIRGVPRVKTVAVTKHIIMIQCHLSSCYSPVLLPCAILPSPCEGYYRLSL
jgi:hypothetical protein